MAKHEAIYFMVCLVPAMLLGFAFSVGMGLDLVATGAMGVGAGGIAGIVAARLSRKGEG